MSKPSQGSSPSRPEQVPPSQPGSERAFDALDAELRQMTPRAPSADLKAWIRGGVKADPPAVIPENGNAAGSADRCSTPGTALLHWLRKPFPGAESRLAAAAALVAACFSIALWVQSRGGGDPGAPGATLADRPVPAPSVSAVGGEPASAGVEPGITPEPILVNSMIEGVVEPDGGPAMWKVRYDLLHRTSWTDETGDARERLVPEERILYLPVGHD